MNKFLRAFFASLAWTISLNAHAATLGFVQLPATASSPEISLFYPSSSPATRIQQGRFALSLAWEGAWVDTPQKLPLLLISHGSGGAPWPLSDLARAFVDAGYAVALPTHAGDNHRDMRNEGPASWVLRPREISQTLDALAAHPHYSKVIETQRAGVYGTSAGGFNALVLAGGQWSQGNFMRHCLANMEKDFHACVGLATYLRGNALDGIKLAVARAEHRRRFDDDTMLSHHEPRIRAAVASVPMAAPFDMASFARPGIPLGIIEAGQDVWLHPQFHSERVLNACKRCELIARLAQAGHGSLFSPWPQDLAASLSPMLVDPAGFDRSSLPNVYAQLVTFFNRHLSAPQ
ncbi:dienelactone hydrolase [Variovorax sp. PCZ-1]|uniref:alpha/beta hydrolase family protein n=1 Tax=Variovorax sp. PCZ-1 TaxID=2835533 RepID=UPI001BCB7814|nr:dienelactone hydrolase [Variovorax sp. PCZ-1]MBS7806725.1 dienelactone hydrolase [Variovorax sp. PCZ-1]